MYSLRTQRLMTGNEAVAYAVKQADVDFIAAYPITPQTIIVERLSEYVASGEINAEFVPVESEHSALSACIGASLSGARVFTSSSAQGLALMHEVMYIASGLRCPIVMAVANRALSAPLNIHGDHSDIMGSRDSGWVQIFCENPQEVYDYTIQAFRLAEHPDVLLPVTVNLDGFTVSHSSEPVAVLEDSVVKEYLPRHERPRLDYYSPASFGVFALPTHYFEFKVEQEKALRKAGDVFNEVAAAYPDEAGRLVKLDKVNSDGRIALVCMGGTTGTLRHVLKQSASREFSLISLKLFTPFPSKEILEALSDAEGVVVMDRATSPGAPLPPLASNIVASLYEAGINIPVLSVVYGLGGREPTLRLIREMLEKAKERLRTVKVRVNRMYLGYRGEER
ncbi:MAG: pyruvate ferredoxin oxidoreductase [Nitrososphaerota archaeon]|nr:pyruvate ferredoxin oxidoreductase [Candidatus Calditenuaceae archaeon]MDW8072729.1 pyruvate ferredoxin oxidoreductase [Nitrososphaerota archaeon]